MSVEPQYQARLTELTEELEEARSKGLLAMDESNPTCNKRFAALNIPQTIEFRRAYREMIVTTPDLGESISGAILYDETIRQQKKDGTPFAQALTAAGIIPGIKLDAGAKCLAGHAGEKVTEGLDGQRETNRRVCGDGREVRQVARRHCHRRRYSQSWSLSGQCTRRTDLPLTTRGEAARERSELFNQAPVPALVAANGTTL